MTEEELAILAIEKAWWKHQGVKETHIHRELGLSPTLYYLKLNKLLDSQEALAAEPILINRLRNKRESYSQN